MNSLFLYIQSIVSFMVDKTISVFSNINYNTYILFILFGFSKMRVNIHNTIKHHTPGLYENYQSGLVFWNRQVKYMFSLIYNHRIEPNEVSWINHSTLDHFYPNIHSDAYSYIEKYEYLPDLQIDYTTLFNTSILLTYTKSFINETNTSQLFTMKHDEKYIYRILSTNTNIITPYCIKPSKTHFLSIIYTHPKLDNGIHIEIPKNGLLQGNEILSQHFILRYLEYQSFPFWFDLKYTLQIMDNNINQFTLSSNQYLLLSEKEYIIKNLPH